MKIPINVRKFLAFVVLACWLGLTLLFGGMWIADNVATTWSEHEAVFLAKPQSDDVNQLKAEADAGKNLLDFEQSQTNVSSLMFKIWTCLTLLGSALFAERREKQ